MLERHFARIDRVRLGVHHDVERVLRPVSVPVALLCVNDLRHLLGSFRFVEVWLAEWPRSLQSGDRALFSDSKLARPGVTQRPELRASRASFGMCCNVLPHPA